MSQTQNRLADILPALGIIGLSIYVIFTAIPWGFLDLVGPGPAFFPVVYGVLMLALGLALLWRGARGRLVAKAKSIETAEGELSESGGALAALVTWGALALAIPAMMAGGFVIGFFLFVFFLEKTVFKLPLWKSAVVAVAIAIGLFLLFHVALEVDLPESRLWAYFMEGA